MDGHDESPGHNGPKGTEGSRWGRLIALVFGTGGLAAGLAALIGVYVAAAAAGHWFPFEPSPSSSSTTSAPHTPTLTSSAAPTLAQLNSALLPASDLGEVTVPTSPVGFCSAFPDPSTVSNISNYEWDSGVPLLDLR